MESLLSQDVNTCYSSMVSSIRPLEVDGIEGFLGHIWESARLGPRVVEEWPRFVLVAAAVF
jgi:hypothetical protein